MARKHGLGRGLDALLGPAATREENEVEAALRELPIEALRSGPFQPRRDFDEVALEALAESIRAQGVVEPLIVRPAANGFEVVAGERRWRASQRAGLRTVPALVRQLDARAAMTIALVENIQRADLNPMEEAAALKRLIEECHLTHEQAATAVGRSRASISNLLRLLGLPEPVQLLVREGVLSSGHAKVLLGAPVARQGELAQKVVALGLSVRQTEALVKRRPVDTANAAAVDTYIPYMPSLRAVLGSRVRIRAGRGGAGQVIIPFRDRDALEALISRLDAG